MLCVSASFGACTPIDPVGSKADMAAMAPEKTDAGTAGQGGSPGATTTGTGTCAPEGTRTCPGPEGQPRRLCQNGSWMSQPPCAANEVCDTTDDAHRGECQPAATECARVGAGNDYCDGEMRRRCIDASRSIDVPCDPNMHCNAKYQKCTCVFGTVDTGEGCQPPTDCTVEQGGCDMLTTCTIQNGGPVCGACPSGYLGDGGSGCKPLLTSLTASCGAGAIGLISGTYQYRFPVSMFCQQLTLRPTAPPGTTIEVNGTSLMPEAEWTSEVLSLGDNTFQVALTSASGLANEYTLIVERQAGQDAFLKASNPGSSDRFGYRIALSGDSLAVATPWEDSRSGGVNGDQTSSGAMDSGAVYVFVRKGKTWSQQAYVKAMNPLAQEYFGTSVALDGDTLAVGSSSVEPFILTPSVSRAGSVDLFVRSGETWSFQQRLQASNAAPSDVFGYSVFLQGELLLVGAPGESSQASGSGAVYRFVRDANGFREVEKIKPLRPLANSALGSGIAYDGSSLLVGAWPDSSAASWSGSAYVFTQQNGAWSDQRLEPPTVIDDLAFGKGLAILGDTLVVGAPNAPSLTNREGQVFVFRRSGARWSWTSTLAAPVPRDRDFYGAALLLTPTSLAVGSNGDPSGATGIQGDLNSTSAPLSGAVFLYARRGTEFTYSTFVKAHNTSTGGAFGAEIGLAADTFVSAAAFESSGGSGVSPQSAGSSMNSGAVYVFH